ncbi:MAG: hypothetical protein WAQ28_09155 [Bacteroidia bacterium]
MSINTSGAEPDASAILDVASTNSGFLVPRLTTAQRQAIPSPAQGLLIYNTTTNYFNIYVTGSIAGWHELSYVSYIGNTTGVIAPDVGVLINSSGASAEPSAICDINSTTKGLLIPRTTTASITPGPVTGLSIYETSTNVISYYNGSAWIPLCGLYINNTTGGGSLAGTPGVSINTSGSAPNDCAMLDVASSNKGLLIPRLTNTERDDLNPATGLLVYNTTTNLLNYWNGTGWYSLSSEPPSIPGAITGSTSVCEGAVGEVYSIASVAAATSYTWAVPTDATITSGQGTTSITVTFGSISDTVSVTASNPCGSSSSSKLGVTIKPANEGFKTEWATTGASETITLPLNSSNGSAFNCTVYWGDGSNSSITSATDPDRIHTYVSAGTYTVEILGQCEGWSFNNTGDKLKIKKIISWGDKCLFDGFKYLQHGFYGCTNLTTLSTGSILASGTGCNNFHGTFLNCSGLTSIPTGLFDLHTQVAINAFRDTFFGCTGLTGAIPTDLFRYNTMVSTSGFYRTFYNCSGITSIPTDLFRYNTLLSTNGFVQTFYSCDGITSIPTDLFRYNTLVSNFNGTFINCSGITSIPVGLFNYNTQVAASAFDDTFFGCSGITGAIPTDLFRYNTLASTSAFSRTFYNCSGITSIPIDLFRYNTLVSTNGFVQTFYNCDGITSIPTDLFRYNTIVSSFNGTFTNCSGITSIPAGLFDYNTQVAASGFADTFFGCTGLTGAIPTDLFRYNTLASTSAFSRTFYNCSGITSIPTDLFRYNTAVSTNGFVQTFYGCSGITSIPTDLFRYNTIVSSFNGTFTNCSGITSIPAGLFDYNTQVAASGFADTFFGCTGLTSIPTDLFRYNTLVSTSGFSRTFYNCSGITSIPTDLFRYNTAVSTSGFVQTFYGCTGLTSVPTDLFRYNTAVSTNGFIQTFFGCSGLTSVPTDLFRYNTAVTSFSSTFSGCTKLQLNRNIFFADGEEGTRFLNKSVDFTSCFSRTSFTGVQGEAPYLWNCNFGSGTVTKTSCFAGAGNSTTSLSNYPDELMTIDVAPATDWSNSDIITGQTSTRTCKIAGSKITNTTYIVNSRGGLSYTLGEIIGVTGTPTKLADQGAANPTFATSGWK